MKKSKGIKSFVVFVVVLLFFAGIYYVSFLKQQGSPTGRSSESAISTSGWKTYSSTKYKFSFKYPPNLLIRMDSRDEFIGFLERPNENSSQRVVVFVVDNPQNMDIQEFAEKNRPIPDDHINVQREKTKVNGYNALITRSELPCLGLCPNEKTYKSFSVAVQGNGFIVSFSDEKGDEALINQILSTFTII